MGTVWCMGRIMECTSPTSGTRPRFPSRSSPSPTSLNSTSSKNKGFSSSSQVSTPSLPGAPRLTTLVTVDKAVQTFFVDNLDPGDAVGAAKRARKISSHATFFKAGQCLGRTLVCIVKSGSVSSTIKTLEPIDQVRGKKQPALRKFLQGTDSLRVFKVGPSLLRFDP
jgi:hypothetical protein